MIRFITKILMISTFFVGLGAMAEIVWNTVSQNNKECRRVIKIDEDIDFDKHVDRKIVILRKDWDAF